MDQRLLEEYERIANSEELTDEAKKERAARAYERNAERIREAKVDAKQTLLRDAALLEHKALPWPEKQAKDISNNTELLSLAYSESETLVRLVEKRSKITAGGREKPNPMFDATDFLRGKYAEGIGIGGAQGSALCAGVLRASEELSVDAHDVVDPLRSDLQRQQLDDARLNNHYSRFIDTSVPRPSRGLSDKSRRSPVHGLTCSPSGPRVSKKRRRTWN
jgi:hypothetical protein